MLGLHWEKENIAKAVGFQKKSCDLGDGMGCITFGNFHEFGLGVSSDEKIAEEYYNKALPMLQEECGKDQILSCYLLATALEQGKGGKPNKKEALLIFEKLCESVELPASFACRSAGKLWKNGVNREISPNGKKAKRLFLKARKIEEKLCEEGNYPTCYNVGIAWRDGEDDLENKVQARRFFEKACSGKHGDGCTSLGVLLYSGEGGDEDKVGARTYYSKGCELDSEYGCLNLGYLWKEGIGGLQNYEEAVKCFRKAAELGSAEALYNLGEMCVKFAEQSNLSRKISLDMDSSVSYGSLKSTSVLNSELVFGRTEEAQDSDVQAHMWFNLAASKNYEDSATKRDEIEKRMEMKQITKAQELAKRWFEKHGQKLNGQ